MFGRNDFNPIDHAAEVPQAIRYLTKYLEKTGEKLVYSRGLYRYFVTDVMDEDIICLYGENKRSSSSRTTSDVGRTESISAR